MVRRPGTPARAACLASPPAELTGGDRRARITRREQQHGRGRDQLTPGSRLDGVVLKRGHVCPPLENGRKLSRRLQVGNNTARDFAAASAKRPVNRKGTSFTYHQQPMNRITLAHPRASIAKPGPNMARHEGTPRAPRSGQIQLLGSCDAVRGPRCPPL